MAGTQRREQENGRVLNWEEARGAQSWVWEQEEQMRWSEQWSCLLPAPEPHYFWYPEGLVYLWSHGAFDIIGKDSRDFVSAFLSRFSQEHFMLSSQPKINWSGGSFSFHFVREDFPASTLWRLFCPYWWQGSRGAVRFHFLRVGQMVLTR